MRYPQAILVSCEIPWDENENLMEDVFREEVRHFLHLGFNNIYIFGTAGEGYAVDTARFQQIVEIFHEETNVEGALPQVGVIGLSAANILERICFAHKLGFRVFQISLPCWGALNDNEVMKFFTDVCGAFPDSRFLHYNLMRTKRLLTAQDYRRIIDVVPNLVATKNTSPDVGHTAALMKSVSEMQHFFGEKTFPVGCVYGPCSLLSSFAGLFPSKTKELFHYAQSGELEKLFQIQKKYLSVVDEIEALMIPSTLIDGAYDKMLVRLSGSDMPLRLLSPYQSLSEKVYDECRRILDEKYPGWLH